MGCTRTGARGEHKQAHRERKKTKAASRVAEEAARYTDRPNSLSVSNNMQTRDSTERMTQTNTTR